MPRVVWLGLAGLGLVLAVGIALFLRPAGPESVLPAAELTPADQPIQSPIAVGQQVFWLAGAGVYRLDLMTGTEPERVTTLPFVPQAIRFAPDGRQALIQDDVAGGQWHHVDLAGGAAKPLNASIRQPTWSADSDQLLYSFTGTTPPKLSVARPDGTAWQNLIDLPRGFGALVWPGEGLYAVGLDLLSTPARYVRILISSRRIETVLELERSEASLRTSPAGRHVLLDSGTDTEQSVSLLELASGTVSLLLPDTNVTRSIWLDDDTVVAFQTGSGDSPRLVRRSLGSNEVEILLPWPSGSPFPDDLLAATNDRLIFVSGGQLRSRGLP